MSTRNINQLLSRNISSLSAKTILMINIVDEGFIAEYKQTYPTAMLDCYHTDFAQYQANKPLEDKQLSCHFSAQYQSSKTHDLVIIRFPKSKAELNFMLAMVAHAVNEHSVMLFVGENKSGIKSITSLTKNALQHCQKIDAARHCLLFSGRYCLNFLRQYAEFSLDEFFHYYQIAVANKSLTVAALPGVFSQKSLDIGTEVLLKYLPTEATGKILDFGCGCGIIAAAIACTSPNSKLTLADVNALALASAKKTLAMNQLTAEFIATDSLSHINGQFEQVISNPPFHQGLKTNYQATEQFLTKITHHLSRNATVTIVANSFLKYRSIMEEKIGPTKLLTSEKGFTVYQCQK